MRSLFIAIAISLISIGCGRSSSPAWEADGFRPILVNGVPAKAMWGHWRTRGYGYRVTIDRDGLQLLCETKSFVYSLPKEFGEALLVGWFRIEPATGHLLVTEDPRMGWRVLERSEPPRNPRSLDESWTPIERMQVFQETMQEHYAFFDRWQVDWDERSEEYATQVSLATTDAQLFELQAKMLAGLNDAHLTFSAIVDGEERSAPLRKGPTKEGLREQFARQDQYEDLNSYFNAWFQAYLRAVDERVLNRAGKKAVTNRLRWGWLDGEVGYVQLTHLNGYGAPTVQAAYDLLDQALETVVHDLKNAKAMIVDLSFNQGGMELPGLALAGRFADQQRLAFTKQAVVPGDQEREAYVVPSSRSRYLGPVYVICSDLTVSSGESTVLYLKCLPNVTLVGQPTRGALSDMLEKPLPGNVSLTLSNEVYTAPNGECYERTGVPVAHELVVFDPDDPWRGHPECVEQTRRLALSDLAVVID